MNIGNLYTVNLFYWLLFPTKEASDAAFALVATTASATTASATTASASAAYWSKQYNCEVTYFSPDSYIVFLEEDGNFKKVLTSDGRIGWTWFDEHYNDCFEEVKVAV